MPDRRIQFSVVYKCNCGSPMIGCVFTIDIPATLCVETCSVQTYTEHRSVFDNAALMEAYVISEEEREGDKGKKKIRKRKKMVKGLRY